MSTDIGVSPEVSNKKISYPTTLRGWTRFADGSWAPGAVWSSPIKEAAANLEEQVQIVGAIALGGDKDQFSRITLANRDNEARNAFMSLAKIAGNGFNLNQLPEWAESLNGFHEHMRLWTGVRKLEDLSIVLVPEKPESQGVAVYSQQDMATVTERLSQILQPQQSVNGTVSHDK